MHGLEFKKEKRTPKPWFQSTETKIDLPLLKTIKVDGKTYELNPLDFLQEIEINDFKKLEQLNGKKSFVDYVAFNLNKTFGLITLQNVSTSHIYYLKTMSSDRSQTDLIDLSTLEHRMFDMVGKNVWSPIVLKLNE